jgi:squalene synthase HpnC
MAVDHYENFPVASVLLPRKLRRPVELIYAFARQADDFADEGDWPADVRLQRLSDFSGELDRIERGEAPSLPLFAELVPVIVAHRLPIPLFRDLLSAFSQDVVKTRYADFGDVMNYCRRSANPVGRLLLHLYDAADVRNLAWSDGICSSLQLINFLQDVEVDFHKNRIYLPQDEMAKYGVNESQIAARDSGGGWRALMLFQIDRARRMLQAGAPLGKALPGRIGLELRMIVMGGNQILEKLHASGGDIFHRRPVLKPMDWAYMLYRALIVY